MYSFPNFEPVHCSMSSSNCCFLIYIQVSQEAGNMAWYSHLFKNFPQFVVIHTVKGFGIVNKAEVSAFSGTFLLFWWSKRCWQFDLWFLCLFKIQLKHLEVHGSCTVKSSLENFEHYFTSAWDECNCAVVWTFFGIAFFGIGMTTHFLQSCGHCWSFQICWHIECITLITWSFRISSSYSILYFTASDFNFHHQTRPQ